MVDQVLRVHPEQKEIVARQDLLVHLEDQESRVVLETKEPLVSTVMMERQVNLDRRDRKDHKDPRWVGLSGLSTLMHCVRHTHFTNNSRSHTLYHFLMHFA